jgi:hypothetical protein
MHGATPSTILPDLTAVVLVFRAAAIKREATNERNSTVDLAKTINRPVSNVQGSRLATGIPIVLSSRWR